MSGGPPADRVAGAVVRVWPRIETHEPIATWSRTTIERRTFLPSNEPEVSRGGAEARRGREQFSAVSASPRDPSVWFMGREQVRKNQGVFHEPPPAGSLDIFRPKGPRQASPGQASPRASAWVRAQIGPSPNGARQRSTGQSKRNFRSSTVVLPFQGNTVFHHRLPRPTLALGLGWLVAGLWP